MIKYFHELTEDEFNRLVEQKLTWGECAKLYPQPVWCSYPEATMGEFGCWSLVLFMVKNEEFCKRCDCYISEHSILQEEENVYGS